MTRAPRTLAVAIRDTGFAIGLAVGVALAATTASAAEAVYRWVDANGVVHFTQTAPRGIPYERVTPSGPGTRQEPSFYNPRRAAPAPAVTSSAPEAPEASGDAPLTPEQEQRQAQLQAEAQARLSEMAAERQRNCELAREQFEEFTTFARIRVADGQGGVRILTEAERAERIAEAEEAILLNCDGAG